MGRPGMPILHRHLSRLAQTGEQLFLSSWRAQYGALCSRIDPDTGRRLVLLVTSRGSGRWVIPKGNPMNGMRPHEVAACEAKEEAGAKGRIRKHAIGHYCYVKRLDNGCGRPCIVDVFSLQVTSMIEQFKERGERLLIWVTPQQAAQLVEEPELRMLIASAR
ncbi:NUDIX hydrolase [Ensifer sp. ENS06]|nr:NUDIX hydrolase [Ensifer sp. ENS06]